MIHAKCWSFTARMRSAVALNMEFYMFCQTTWNCLYCTILHPVNLYFTSIKVITRNIMLSTTTSSSSRSHTFKTIYSCGERNQNHSDFVSVFNSFIQVFELLQQMKHFCDSDICSVSIEKHLFCGCIQRHSYCTTGHFSHKKWTQVTLCSEIILT